MGEPTTDRPVVPDGYGVPETGEGLLAWSEVEARLDASAQYWMATTRPTADLPSPTHGSDDAGGLVRFTPTKALAWFDFPLDETRFKFI